MRNMDVLELARSRSFVADGLLAIAGSLWIALCSQVSCTFPFTPVPFALQAQSVLLVAYLLGPTRGFLTVCAYLFEGIMGLPVFAQGSFGIGAILGPTGGYLLSYLPVSFAVGWLAARDRTAPWQTAVAIFSLATIAVLLFGALWLAGFVGFAAAWTLGVYPFILGDMLKVLMLTITLPAWRKGALWLA